LAVAAVFLALGATAPAQAQDRPEDFRRSMGNLRPDNPTAFPAIQGSNRPHAIARPNAPAPQPSVNPGVGVYPVYPRYRVYYPPAYGYGYGYPAPYYGYPPYYYGYRYYYGPVFVPAETMYGPAAVRRFMGAGW